MLTDEEALTAALDRSSGLDQLHPNDAFGAGFHAALAWLRSQEKKLTCGHPDSLLLRSVETDQPLYCELCDAQSARRDAESMEAGMRAELDALRGQPAIPDGYRLVPVEPTPEMVKAMQDTFWTGKSTYSLHTTDAYRVFFAMLAAAPEPKSC